MSAGEPAPAVTARDRRGLRREGAREGIEAGVAVGGLAVDARGLRVALAAQLLRVAFGLGQDHGALAIGLGADRLRLLVALGAQAAGHLLALGTHAPVNVADHGAVGGQVDLLDAQVDDADADVLRADVDVVELALDHLGAVAGHYFGQRARVDLVAQRILDDRRQAHHGDFLRGRAGATGGAVERAQIGRAHVRTPVTNA